MDRALPRTGPVVVGIDSTADIPAALWAAEQCRHAGLSLHLVAFPGNAAGAGSDTADDLLRQASAAVSEHAPGVRIVTSISAEAAVPALTSLSGQAVEVVIAERGLAPDWSAADATAWAVASHSRCPVIIWRSAAEPSPSAPVVVGLDGSAVSTAALEFALRQASWLRVPLVAVMAWSDVFLDADEKMLRAVSDWRDVVEDHRRMLAEQLAGAQERFPDVSIERVLTRDRPVRALLKEAATAQLLVVGSRGRGGFSGMLLGSVSRALIDYAPCPLAVVRPVSAD